MRGLRNPRSWWFSSSFSWFAVIARAEKKNLEKKLRYLLEHLSREHELFPILYKIIAQTRDIVDGKGEYELAFMQLRVWWITNENSKMKVTISFF